ncbi:hypothetical protein FO519_007730 [Halicephalobus sp. NKZ332]|nr:hypothetical protein FO519_007730 [Halicephalobus sp. NKZ332]
MDEDEKNFQANVAVLEKFRKNPAYKLYWENWKRGQDWILNCEKTHQRFQEDLPEINDEDRINSLLNLDEENEHQMDFESPDIPEDDDEMAEYYNVTIKHKQEMEERRKKQQEEEALLPQVEYVDATEVGIHGINSANVNRQTFRSRVQEHIKRTEELYGPHAERIITMESTANFKFDELISKHGSALWPNIPFRL